MEWLVAALTIVFGIVSIALWINYCSVGDTERKNSKGDIKARGSTSTGEGETRCSAMFAPIPGVLKRKMPEPDGCKSEQKEPLHTSGLGPKGGGPSSDERHREPE